MSVSVLAEALVRWQHAAGPFWPYVCAAPFLGTAEGTLLAQRVMGSGRGEGRNQPRISGGQSALVDRLVSAAHDLTPFRTGEAAGGDEVAPWNGGLPLILADVPAEPVLAVAPLLAARGWYVVPIVQRWIATPAVLPCRQLVERLVVGARQMKRPAAPVGAILIVDGERTGSVDAPLLVPGRTFDNRYEYQTCRFPSTRFLQAQGVRRVRWITSARPAGPPGSALEQPMSGLPPVARDLHPYREALLLAGIEVNVTVWPPA
jgi:hypothetical protein